jgi:outer membrane protein OmpA-like peptidoglycan-associated protein
MGWMIAALLLASSAPAAQEAGRWRGCDLFETPRGTVVVDRFASAFFEPGSSRIKREARAMLDSFVSNYDAPPTCTVVIDGHSDSAESKPNDLSLSRHRAEAVAKYLRRKGLAAPIRVRALGGTRPLVETPNGVGERQNRYVQVWVDDPSSSSQSP